MAHVMGIGWFVALSCITTMPGRSDVAPFFFLRRPGRLPLVKRRVIPAAIDIILLMLLIVVDPCAGCSGSIDGTASSHACPPQ